MRAAWSKGVPAPCCSMWSSTHWCNRRSFSEAARVYADTRERSVPMWNGDPVRATLDLTVTLPTGARVEELPPDAEGRATGIGWSIRSERTRDGFHLARRVEIPTGRVTPADYGPFAEQARALDTADTRRITIALP